MGQYGDGYHGQKGSNPHQGDHFVGVLECLPASGGQRFTNSVESFQRNGDQRPHGNGDRDC